MICAMKSLAMPIRYSDSAALILLAVAVASPATIKTEGMYTMLKAAVNPINRYSSPATLAVLLIEFMSSPHLLLSLRYGPTLCFKKQAAQTHLIAHTTCGTP